ncbi:MAG: hypothetical protein M3R41_04035 [Pseudomonadota bacterium]|nr:hypothetical protein [Pseudomonadota bacterium]
MAGRDLFVIIDGDHVAEWQRRALATLPAEDQLTLLSCTNTAMPRRLAKHPFYYALNLLSVRNPLTRQVSLTGIAAPIVARHVFAAGKDGAWQMLPDEIVALIAAAKPDAVIKLGMTLMRVTAALDGIPILSWHHGDPDAYRGRPAGFYEMLHGKRTMGQIVQVIGNKLDAGAVVAFAETRITTHSWRKTLIESFRHSPLLLEEALRNIAARRTIAKQSDGRNYRLPGNAKVAKLSLGMVGHAIRRVAYGAFVEKKWMVSTAAIGSADALAVASGAAPFPPLSTWHTATQLPQHVFQADPFFRPGANDLLVEALNAATGKGQIVLIDGTGPHVVSRAPCHFSYPAAVRDGDTDYIVPEIAGWSEPKAYVLGEGGLCEAGRLDIPGNPRLSDPTFLRHDGRLWLFGNIATTGSNALYLWHAAALFDRFEPHPLNPIRITPRGARMGGAILTGGEHPVRLGQNFINGYGDGLFAFAIRELTPDAYREEEIGELRFADCKGPHTFNLSPDGTTIAFDWYRDGFSPMAGIRRLRNRRR